MCGIIGYIGPRPILSVLLEGLKRLEYRGYDSAGLVAVAGGKADFARAVGKVANLEKQVGDRDIAGCYGIAHTRWATHGKPSTENAHPHRDCREKVFVIHNGIIENFQGLKEMLQQEGHGFRSETDTEVIAHLVEKYFAGDLEKAVLQALQHLRGTFGIAVIHVDADRQIVVAKRGSPIMLGIGEGELFVASDSNTLIPYTNKLISLNDDELAVLSASGYHIKNLNNEFLEKKVEIYDRRDFTTDRQGFEHFMLKEIFEQPESIENAYRGRILESEGVSKLGGLEPVLERLKKIQRLVIVSCGTSYYAGLAGRNIFDVLTGIPVDVAMASEFRYQKLKFDQHTAVLAISQSGETADTIAAVKEAKRKGALLLGIVNTVGSSLTQITDAGVYNHAGPEFGVASTKIYTSQLVILTLMALLIGRYQGLSYSEGLEVIRALQQLPEQVRQILAGSAHIQKLAEKYAGFRDALFIGRLYNFPTALEGALKLKEISYIHAEAYAAGEMKHGPISLIDENFPTVAIAPADSTFEKMIGNIQEIRARNGRVIVVTTPAGGRALSIAADSFQVPETLPILQPVLCIIPLQLFAYYLARSKGCDIDKPRNLAKSVTVE